MSAESADATATRADGPLGELAKLSERGKEPRSTGVLERWVAQAQNQVGLEAGRLGWLIASAVVIAALQRAVDEEGRSRFLLKGGTYLQYRLNWAGRPTKDVDGLVRGDIADFLAGLDAVLALPWGPFALTRSDIEVIDVPGKVLKPRRFNVQVQLRGDVWRRVKIEISPDEGGASDEDDVLPAPPLGHFGIPSPDQLVGITLRYQIAQKIHACTDPHSPPEHVNDRARDLADLLLLRRLVEAGDAPSLPQLRQACLAVFAARAAEAAQTNHPSRAWPPTVVAHAHWGDDYAVAAEQAGLAVDISDAVNAINAWIAAIDATGHVGP